MFYVSDIQTAAPKHFKTVLQQKVYQVLAELHIPFQRVDTDEAVSMEDCEGINRKLDMDMVKTLFLCDRKQRVFYLFVTCGDRQFSAKDFSHALGVSRVSFAPVEYMSSMLGTVVGAATVFSVLLESAGSVNVVFDRDVLAREWYGCSDGTTTGYMKIRTADIVQKLLPYSGHEPVVIEV